MTNSPGISRLKATIASNPVQWAGTVRRLHGLDIGYCAPNNLGLGVDKMEASHNCMNPVRAGDFLSLFDGIDDPGMSATGKNHQPFSFYLEEERLLAGEGIRFEILATLDQKRLRHLLIGGNPFDIPLKYAPGTISTGLVTSTTLARKPRGLPSLAAQGL